MTTHWILKTHGSPLTAVQSFLMALFKSAKLDAMLAPLRVNEPVPVAPRMVEDPAQLAAAVPFAPLMALNAANLAAEFGQTHPGKHLGAVLRACEVRALVEISRRGVVDLDQLLVVGVDCLGTFSAADAGWRGSIDDLTEEMLQFARQGGVAVYRYRPACQMCIETMPEAADLTIDLLGLPARQHLVISARDRALAGHLGLDAITDGPAPPSLVQQHTRVRALVAGRRARARQRITQALDSELAKDVATLVEHLQNCAPCRQCLDTCPIYVAETAGQAEVAITHELVTRWLASCVGCGMCEEVCPDHLPLATIFRRLQEHILTAFDNPANHPVAAASPPG